MDRADLQQLAALRLKDAEVLLAAGQWDGAYYLLGYCIECALKACVARQFRLYEVPERKLVNSFYTHRLDELLLVSGVKPALDSQVESDTDFRRNWHLVRDWSEAARYEIAVPESKARGMYDAVANDTSGILPWLKVQW